MLTAFSIIFWLCLGLIAYHHVGYPMLLRVLAHRRGATRVASGGKVAATAVLTAPVDGEGAAQSAAAVADDDERRPRITILIPAHNEEAVIAAKTSNVASLLYPREALSIVIALDGCTDRTQSIAEATISELSDETAARIELVALQPNRGKVAVLNELIAKAETDVVVLSDASATVMPDALWRIADHFEDPDVGVVCGTYALIKAGSDGESAYWSYQTQIKLDEAAIAAPMGAHGAFYAFRRAAWMPLEPDTINDDFVLPMRIVMAGHRAVYDPQIVASELETTTQAQEFRRRARIGAGNLQQALRLWPLADPRRPGLSFLFLSGKGLRPFVPFLAIVVGLSGVGLFALGNIFVGAIIGLGALTLVAAVLVIGLRPSAPPKALAWLAYLVEGHAASLVGAVQYLSGRTGSRWGKAPRELGMAQTSTSEGGFLPRSVAISKRIFDIICALGALLVLAVVFIPVAILIKWDSPGPVFYRQLRVGRAFPDRVELFEILKFRTMRQDAEVGTGAVLAKKNDARITRLGAFMRKYRIDELPQCINVLKGEMSVIGPRPERPQFFLRYEDEIPFYSERCYGLRPGITGLAQVRQCYDEDIEDVRRKVGFDHAYALKLSSWGAWLRTDTDILLRTVSTMALGKGQ